MRKFIFWTLFVLVVIAGLIIWSGKKSSNATFNEKCEFIYKYLDEQDSTFVVVLNDTTKAYIETSFSYPSCNSRYYLNAREIEIMTENNNSDRIGLVVYEDDLNILWYKAEWSYYTDWSHLETDWDMEKRFISQAIDSTYQQIGTWSWQR